MYEKDYFSPRKPENYFLVTLIKLIDAHYVSTKVILKSTVWREPRTLRFDVVLRNILENLQDNISN